jgi:hypothetical protein
MIRSGGGEIRTPEEDKPPAGFQVRCFQPLSHPTGNGAGLGERGRGAMTIVGVGCGGSNRRVDGADGALAFIAPLPVVRVASVAPDVALANFQPRRGRVKPGA